MIWVWLFENDRENAEHAEKTEHAEAEQPFDQPFRV